MPHNAKLFAQKLNLCLDELGLPSAMRERAQLFSKMLDIPKQQAWGLLEGQVFPDEDLLETILTELEVDREWLLDGNNAA